MEFLVFNTSGYIQKITPLASAKWPIACASSSAEEALTQRLRLANFRTFSMSQNDSQESLEFQLIVVAFISAERQGLYGLFCIFRNSKFSLSGPTMQWATFRLCCYFLKIWQQQLLYFLGIRLIREGLITTLYENRIISLKKRNKIPF